MITATKVNLKRLDYETYSGLVKVFTDSANFLAFARQMTEVVFAEENIASGNLPSKYDYVKRIIELSGYDNWKKDHKLSLKRRQLEEVIKRAYDDWIYFFKAIKAYNKNPEKFTGKPRRPAKYKISYPVIQYTSKELTVDKKNNTVAVKYSHRKKLVLRIPDNVDASKLKSVSLIYNGSNFKAIFPNEQQEIQLGFDPDNWVAVDPGVKNTMTIVTHDHRSMIMRTSKLKNLIASKMYLISKKKSRNGNLESNAIKKIRIKYDNKISNELYKIANQFIDFLIANSIGTVILGQSDDFKQNCNLGKKTNRKWVSLPLVKIYEYIEYKCALLGIKVKRVTEEYSSKADALADDEMPETRFEGPQTFKGNRLLRGLYASSREVLINADVNGALNIAKRFFKYVLKKVDKIPSYSNIAIKQLTGLLNPVVIN